ncbi:CH082 protein, partial [Polypterus senegalus]
MLRIASLTRRLIRRPRQASRVLSYVQGQSPEPRVREYFYYVDHQGQNREMCILAGPSTDVYQHFLAFFFSRLQRNEIGRYQDSFPFLSLCGRERNFLRCEDRPVVFTKMLTRGSDAELLSYCGGSERLAVPFRPEALYMHPVNGRLYHPCPERSGAVGLVRSALAIELSPCFEYQQGQAPSGQPTHFHWAHRRWELTNELGEVFNQLKEKESWWPSASGLLDQCHGEDER